MTTIPLIRPFIHQNAIDEIKSSLSFSFDSNQSLIPNNQSKAEQFENKLKEMLGNPYIVVFNSFGNIVNFTFKLLNLESDNEILLTPLVDNNILTSIVNNNIKVKWVDISDNLTIDLNDLKAKLTKDSKCVIIVHWSGNIVNLNELDELKKYTKEKFGYELTIIESFSHALGSKYKDKFIGNWNNICILDFSSTKYFTLENGGMICLPNVDLYNKCKLLRSFGIIEKDKINNEVLDLLNNQLYQLDNLNSSLALSNISAIDNNINIIKSNNDYYQENLKDIEGISLFPFKNKNEINPVNWVFPIKIINRIGFIEHMRNNKIVVSQNYLKFENCLCLFKTMKEINKLNKQDKNIGKENDEKESEDRKELVNFTKLEKNSSGIVCIPSGWWVTNEDRKKIVDHIKEWCIMNKPTIIFRELTAQDRNQYLNLLYQLNNYTIKIETDEEFIKQYTSMKNNGGKIFVLEYDKNLIGTGKLLIETKFGGYNSYIQDVVIDKDSRRKGLGTMIIQHLVDISKKIDCQKISIVTNEASDILKFYEKNNFDKRGFEFQYRK